MDEDLTKIKISSKPVFLLGVHHFSKWLFTLKYKIQTSFCAVICYISPSNIFSAYYMPGNVEGSN